MLEEEKTIELKRELTIYASLVEKMIEDSITGLMEKKADLLEKIVKEEEPKANLSELNIDKLCTAIIAQYQPTATSLRTILMGLKINNDLERMADHAVNISQSALFLIEKPQVKPLVDIPLMADISIKMVKDAIDSFIREDSKLARDVLTRDKKVNDLRNQVVRELITFMFSEPPTIERALQLLRISSNLERVADLATNICEDVIFIVEGEVVKHRRNIEDKA